MRARISLLALATCLATVACGTRTNVDWMKIDQPYTAAEFRRDLHECTVRGELDENCMRGRGWVTVTAPKAEKKELPQYRPGVPQPRY